MKLRSTTIAFRLSNELLPLLDEECKRLKLSHGGYCRALVTSLLMRPENAVTPDELAGTKDEIAGLIAELTERVQQTQSSLRRTLYEILTRVGELNDEEAREVTRKLQS